MTQEEVVSYISALKSKDDLLEIMETAQERHDELEQEEEE